MEQRTIRVYACGGAGMNIASTYAALNKKQSDVFANVQVTYADTSRANVTPLINVKDLFLVDDTNGSGVKDGSGKVRRSNHADIKARTPECLLKFKPEVLNVVMHSASGGSGSVIGPLLVDELLNRGERVIVMMVVSKDSRIEIDNTVKTLKTYEKIAKSTGKPVIAIVEHNDAVGRVNTDKSMHVALDIISGFWSGANREMDTADLNNFLGYTAVTSFDPALASLTFFSKEIVLGKDQVAITVATLTDANGVSAVNIPVEYQAVGFIPESARAAYGIEMPLHATVVAGVFHPMILELDKVLGEYDARRNAVKVSAINVDSHDDDDGVIVL